MAIQAHQDTRSESGYTPFRQRLQTVALLIWMWIAFGLLIALWVREMFQDHTSMAIVIFYALLFLGWCAREVWRQPEIYWPRVWRLFRGEPLVWDAETRSWLRKWSYHEKQTEAKNPTGSTHQQPVSARGADGWIPTSKQWLVIWLSAIFAALVILAGAIDDSLAEAMAALIPLGLGALGVRHLQTRRKG